MTIKTVVDEDFVNYKKASMLIGTARCSGKCCIEAGIPLECCENNDWRNMPDIEISDETLCRRYLKNPLTDAIVIGGLEPMEQFPEVYDFLLTLRYTHKCTDDVVIYTGYNEDEIADKVNALLHFGNIIVKFGRYRPNDKPHYDEVLGVCLVSGNQYGKRL